MGKIDTVTKQYMADNAVFADAFIKYSKDKMKLRELVSNNERYANMDKKAAMVIEACTNNKLKMEEDEEDVNMCQAIIEMCQDEREEGRLECSVEHIKNLMGFLKCTAEKAMDVLKIPESERIKCRERL